MEEQYNAMIIQLLCVMEIQLPSSLTMKQQKVVQYTVITTLHCYNNSNILLNGYFMAIYDNNNATQGGAIYFETSSILSFEQDSTTIFINNAGEEHGGAIFSKVNCGIFFKENSYVTYDSNKAMNKGGSIYSKDNSAIVCTGSSTITFKRNTVHDGASEALA